MRSDGATTMVSSAPSITDTSPTWTMPTTEISTILESTSIYACASNLTGLIYCTTNDGRVLYKSTYSGNFSVIGNISSLYNTTENPYSIGVYNNNLALLGHDGTRATITSNGTLSSKVARGPVSGLTDQFKTCSVGFYGSVGCLDGSYNYYRSNGWTSNLANVGGFNNIDAISDAPFSNFWISIDDSNVATSDNIIQTVTITNSNIAEYKYNNYTNLYNHSSSIPSFNAASVKKSVHKLISCTSTTSLDQSTGGGDTISNDIDVIDNNIKPSINFVVDIITPINPSLPSDSLTYTNYCLGDDGYLYYSNSTTTVTYAWTNLKIKVFE